ncbi:MAG: URC4/urg3 family protein [Sandaracinaceae bacterium]
MTRLRRDTDRPSMQDAQSPIAFLRSPGAIRQRCDDVLRVGLRGELAHFAVVLDALPTVVARVARITRRRYPSLAVPWPSRLDRLRLGGHDRLGALRARIGSASEDEVARILTELTLVSILLGAGAGSRWRYHEKGTGIVLGRTEGLALASYHAYVGGLFSATSAQPLRVDADALDTLDEGRLAHAFEVRSDNPMEGLSGRAELMAQLGSAMRAASHIFGDTPRLGYLFDAMKARATDAAIPARRMLAMLLEVFSPIWPSRCTVMGVSMGDVWPHPAAGGVGPAAGLVPFHTFAQWMTYSLVPVLEGAGLRVEGVAELTGLTEYRTCGLFVDDGVLVPKHDGVLGATLDVGSEIVVEWRALSLALLDRLAEALRAELFGTDAEAAERFPIACVIEGGTWSAGREAAKERRADGGPPIHAKTDGTVF